jgi:hypothetical protein
VGPSAVLDEINNNITLFDLLFNEMIAIIQSDST